MKFWTYYDLVLQFYHKILAVPVLPTLKPDYYVQCCALTTTIIHYLFVSVIVFAVPWHALRMYLLIAHELGMAEGDFAFICVHSDVSIIIS